MPSAMQPIRTTTDRGMTRDAAFYPR
jgi:hypothetical protein